MVRAVRSVSLGLSKGEILGVVGESGSGKTVLCLSLLNLIPKPPARTGGSALFEGLDLFNCTQGQMREIRGNKISMVFQDPQASFNPYLRLSNQLTEPLLQHRNISRKEALERAVSMLDQTGIVEPHRKIHCYPHEFSGGMLQRAMIAMALITAPQILIADEPTTSLDVTVQAQILRRIKELQRDLSMSIIFITHNLGIVAGFCDRVLVMYAGKILESAHTEDLFYRVAHPYTRALIRSVPSLHTRAGELYQIPGMPPDLSEDLSGCPFAPRCEYAKSECSDGDTELREVAPGHFTSCIRVLNGELKL